MKMAIAALALMVAGGSAYAQTSTTTSDPQTPAVATPDSTNPTAPVAGANSFTEAQAKSRLEENGYTNVADLKLDANGVWVAKADKDGKTVDVTLDYQGNIAEGAK